MLESADGASQARQRILQATFKVLSRHGYSKFNLSDVAAQAGISRPTLYKSFSSKEDLLAAFSQFELELVREELARSLGDRSGRERLEAVLQFLVDFYGSYQMRGLIEIEPAVVLTQMGKALPALSELIAGEITGQVDDPVAVAAALVRIAVCHYLVPGGDEHLLLTQLRVAAGVR
ncbi:TetR/AcrR family transcriptional regulator [Mycobacterium sp. TNTM28]|uniref:TetR/AcrR family transcriptional regulator n=1 Tax=[Mycobacterium] fortunisiensis TaxID=2600579 RepID=A0ABS6KIK7_9MYCO|nr:TetR/AcrR family transcriptional regulator [[Mycobacterium] fortunisiensis]MBU9763427.1 TetR/AcrR family transcriptional regulator [[Mycobacterium] fortunisiensis]